MPPRSVTMATSSCSIPVSGTGQTGLHIRASLTLYHRLFPLSMCVYGTVSWECTEIRPFGDAPPPRRRVGCALIGSNLMICGGTRCVQSCTLYNTLLVYVHMVHVSICKCTFTRIHFMYMYMYNVCTCMNIFACIMKLASSLLSLQSCGGGERREEERDSP